MKHYRLANLPIRSKRKTILKGSLLLKIIRLIKMEVIFSIQFNSKNQKKKDQTWEPRDHTQSQMISIERRQSHTIIWNRGEFQEVIAKRNLQELHPNISLTISLTINKEPLKHFYQCLKSIFQIFQDQPISLSLNRELPKLSLKDPYHPHTSKPTKSKWMYKNNPTSSKDH